MALWFDHTKRPSCEDEDEKAGDDEVATMTSSAAINDNMEDNELTAAFALPSAHIFYYFQASLFLSDDKAEKRRFFNAGKAKKGEKKAHRARGQC